MSVHQSAIPSNLSNEIEQKKCNTCDKQKPLSEFSLDKRFKEHHKPRCKDCVARHFRNKYYPKNIERISKRTEKWRQENWEHLKQKAKELRDKHPEEQKARRAVNNAIAAGKFQRQPCEQCGTVKADFHHSEGYEKDKWFAGMWLCRKHHAQLHKELRWKTT